MRLTVLVDCEGRIAIENTHVHRAHESLTKCVDGRVHTLHSSQIFGHPPKGRSEEVCDRLRGSALNKDALRRVAIRFPHKSPTVLRKSGCRAIASY
jgi:hypothetical protein